MRKVKILTIALAIILLTLVAFGGIYIQTQNRMENKVKGYDLGREINSQRVAELKVKTSDNEEEISQEDKLKNYETVKKTIENRLDNLGATDYTISLNKNDGTIRVELPENDYTDMYIYYLTADSTIQIIDKDSKDILIDKDMIKGAKYTYNVNASGSYQVYEEIELTDEGQAKLNEILNEYALLQTEIDGIEEESEASTESTGTESTGTENTEAESTTTENTGTESTGEENSEQTKKVANLTIDETAYEVSKIEKNKITIKIGTETSNSTYVNNYISQAAEIAMLQDSGKMPTSYELYSNRYEYSNITETQLMYFAIAVLAVLLVVLIVYCIIYKVSGILASISFIGFLAIYSLVLRYANVMISVEGLCAIIIIILINLKFNQELLQKTKKLNLLNEAMKITYKDIYLKLIPVIILTLVACLTKWDNLSSFGMVMFWGLVLIASYNFIVTRTFLKLKKNK